MKTITVCCLAAAGTLALTACDAPTPSVRLDVSTDLAALSVAEAVSDRPASEAVKNLRERFRLGRTSDPGVGVFELEQPGAAPAVAFAQRATALGFSGVTEPEVDDVRQGLTRGTLRLVRNQANGAEFFADLARFHRGPGVPRSALRAEQDYATRARTFIAQRFGAAPKGVQLQLYKVRRYLNSTGSSMSGPASEPTVYQVAVSFNSTVNGVPVIGPGGKVAVHLTPSGDVVGHESTLRGIERQRGVVRGVDMLSPDEALGIAEKRLEARGAQASHVLTREEFGYLSRGRDSQAQLLAPYYAYVFEPAPGIGEKKVVELVAAIRSGPLASLVEADEATEVRRKALKAQGAVDIK